MKSFYKYLFVALGSKLSPFILFIYCIISFVAGQLHNDMNLFASSGAIITIFGLISMIKFTTIEKYLNKEAIIESSTGVSGPPLSANEEEAYIRASQEAARVRIETELSSELRGIALTIFGTLIWAYGVYIPIFCIQSIT